MDGSLAYVPCARKMLKRDHDAALQTELLLTLELEKSGCKRRRNKPSPVERPPKLEAAKKAYAHAREKKPPPLLNDQDTTDLEKALAVVVAESWGVGWD